MEAQYVVLGYRIDLYFHEYKPAIEIDKNGHSDRTIDYEIKRQKVIEPKLGSRFVRIGPDNKDWYFWINQ